MKWKSIALAVLVGGCQSVPAAAQNTQCWDRETFLKIISRIESQKIGYGLNIEGRMVEVWVDKDQGFIITLVNPNMLTCLATYGVVWTESEPIIHGEKG